MSWLLAIFSALFTSGDDASVVKTMKAELPPCITLTEPLEQTLNWMEAQGWAKSYPRDNGPDYNFLEIYPPNVRDESAKSYVTFGPQEHTYTEFWETPDLAIDSRIYEIATTSGDGGRAAIWLDDEGKQWFVHLGHDVAGIISDDPVVFLQFLAIGYIEPGMLDATDTTLAQDALAHTGDETGLAIPPTEFQTYLTKTFGRPLPETARALGIQDFSYYGDETSTDPFIQWMIRITPPPSEKELAAQQRFQDIMANFDFDSYDMEDPKDVQRMLDDMTKLHETPPD